MFKFCTYWLTGCHRTPQIRCVLSGKLIDFQPKKCQCSNGYQIHSLKNNNMKIFQRIAPCYFSFKYIFFLCVGISAAWKGQVSKVGTKLKNLNFFQGNQEKLFQIWPGSAPFTQIITILTWRDRNALFTQLTLPFISNVPEKPIVWHFLTLPQIFNSHSKVWPKSLIVQ